MAEQRKKSIRKIAVICSAAVLLLIGTLMAYYSSTDEVTNRLTGNSFDIILTETKWNSEKAREVLPGDSLDKNPQVTNNERADAYVFLRVTVPCDTEMVDQDDGKPLGTIGANRRVPMYKFMVKNGDEYKWSTDFSSQQITYPHWKLVEIQYLSNSQQYVYVYGYSLNGTELTPLKKGETTEPLFDKIHLWNFSEREYESDNDHSVLVESLGIQTELSGHTARDISDIWAILEGDGS